MKVLYWGACQKSFLEALLQETRTGQFLRGIRLALQIGPQVCMQDFSSLHADEYVRASFCEFEPYWENADKVLFDGWAALFSGHMELIEKSLPRAFLEKTIFWIPKFPYGFLKKQNIDAEILRMQRVLEEWVWQSSAQIIESPPVWDFVSEFLGQKNLEPKKGFLFYEIPKDIQDNPALFADKREIFEALAQVISQKDVSCVSVLGKKDFSFERSYDKKGIVRNCSWEHYVQSGIPAEGWTFQGNPVTYREKWSRWLYFLGVSEKAAPLQLTHLFTENKE